MTKTIKLEDRVYQELEEIRGKRETFSDVVALLIKFRRDITLAVWGSSANPRNESLRKPL